MVPRVLGLFVFASLAGAWTARGQEAAPVQEAAPQAASENATVEPALAPQPTPLTAPHQLLLWERFQAVGAEPYFWEVHASSQLAREAVDPERVEFEILLNRFDLWLGNQEVLQSIWADGVQPLVIAQNPVSQSIAPETDQLAAAYLNGILDKLSDAPPSGSWSEEVELFNGELLPGLAATEVTVRFRVEPLTIMNRALLQLTFETSPFSFETENSRVQTTYSGLALVDEAKTTVYHNAFLQQGSVETDGKITRLWHCTHMKLAYDTDERVIPEELFPESLAAASRRFDFDEGRPEFDELDPQVNDLPPKPAWVPGAWLAGRLSNMVLGAIAEGKSNPVPVLSIGSIFLTDTAIEVGGRYHLLYQDIRAELKDPAETSVAEYSYKSPRRYFYEEYSPDAPPENRSPVILPPDEVQGEVKIGDHLFVLGAALPIDASLRPPMSTPPAVYFGPPPSAVAGIGALIPLLGIGGTVALDNDEPSPFQGTYSGTWAPDSECNAFTENTLFQFVVDSEGIVIGRAQGRVRRQQSNGTSTTDAVNVTFRGRVLKNGSYSATGTPDAGVLGRFAWSGTFSRVGDTLLASGRWDAREVDGGLASRCTGGVWDVSGTVQ